ncbi:MAG TPA: hypothetical protein VFZ31_15510 [Vicinamibacterales bacterium]
MTVDLAIVIAIFVFVLTGIVLGFIFGGRKEKERTEELQRAASARGWKMETVSENGYRIHRFSGMTDGVSWYAESAKHAAGGNRRDRRRHIARWHGAWSPGINAPVAIMGVPKGKEEIGKPVLAGEGFIAQLAQKAAGLAFDKAIDVYFGRAAGQEVDAGAMRRVEAKLPGFIVMAANTEEGARVLSQGLEQALLNASNDRNSVLGQEDRPWVLLRPKAISLARMELYRDINELDGFVRAGVALTRAFKFGRPTA